jgi:hypothetical protein
MSYIDYGNKNVKNIPLLSNKGIKNIPNKTKTSVQVLT